MANKKNCKIELLRFLAALMIMDGHIGVLFSNGNIERPFSSTWFYVEFFFMITSYFTVKHFDKDQYREISIDRKVTEGIKYTIKKFTAFLPYTTLPILLMYLVSNCYILHEQGKLEFLKSFESMPFEMIYLSAGMESGTKLFPLWFISAMFIVFPLFCFLCQLRNRKIVCLIAAYSGLFYYFSKYDYGSHIYPNQMIRAFSAMLLGYVVYEVVKWLQYQKLNKNVQFIITVLECFSALFPVILSVWNIKLLRIYLVCFIIYLICTFCGHSFIPECNSRILIYLGKLSMPIYIWHYLIGTLINRYLNFTIGYQIILFYMITILVSVINIFVVDKIIKWR